MPGRTPRDAVEAYLAPLRDALRVLDGVAKLSVSPKGGFRTGVRYSWVLNGADGMDLGPAGRFIASMEFEVIETDPARNEYGYPLRVTARSYHYKLRGRDGKDQWRMHWHPDGRSRVTGPHLHLPPNLKQHWPTGRMTLENALGWCVESGAAVTTVSAAKAQEELAMIEAPHRLYDHGRETPSPNRGLATTRWTVTWWSSGSRCRCGSGHDHRQGRRRPRTREVNRSAVDLERTALRFTSRAE